MDHREEVAKFKWLLFAGIAFLLSAYFSWHELKYAVWGATAEATIVRTFETTEAGRRGTRRHIRIVEYNFANEDGARRRERDDVSLDWTVPDDKVTVQYLPGVEGSSRIKGNSNMLAVWIFLGCLAWLGFAGYRLYRQAGKAVGGKSPGR